MAEEDRRPQPVQRRAGRRAARHRQRRQVQPLHVAQRRAHHLHRVGALGEGGVQRPVGGGRRRPPSPPSAPPPARARSPRPRRRRRPRRPTRPPSPTKSASFSSSRRSSMRSSPSRPASHSSAAGSAETPSSPRIAPDRPRQLGAPLPVAGDDGRRRRRFQQGAQLGARRRVRGFQHHQPRPRPGQRGLGRRREAVAGVAHPHQGPAAGERHAGRLRREQAGIAPAVPRHLDQPHRVAAGHGLREPLRPLPDQAGIVAVQQHHAAVPRVEQGRPRPGARPASPRNGGPPSRRRPAAAPAGARAAAPSPRGGRSLPRAAPRAAAPWRRAPSRRRRIAGPGC